jgi:serine/threonine-protein kinase RsbW
MGARNAHSKSLKVSSQTSRLKSVRDFVTEEASRFGFDEETVNKISIAVDEACTNVIKHSFNYAEDREIEVTVKTSDGAFEVIVSHDGKSFDPEEIKPPDMKEYLTHYRRGGLGMHLMRSLMDKVEYRSSGKSRNEVHLIKLLPVPIRRQ